MESNRLTTPEQLRELCWTGEEIVHRAIDGGDAERARAAYDTVVDARVALAGTSHAGDRLAAHVDGGEAGEAKRLWADVEQALLKSHDLRREWVTALWAHVYRAHGADALNELLLAIGREPAWSDFVRESAAKDVVDQVRDWAFLLCVGNFGVASIVETDDQFVLHYNVCGSCGRQELGGRYERPWRFPRIDAAIPQLNGGDPLKTVYRAHQNVLHDVVAIEVVGFPWPVIECQGPGGPGGCGMRFYKDPERIPDRFFERVGLRRPRTAASPSPARRA